MLVKADRDNYWMLNWLDEFMAGHKGFICGGCFKDIFSKEKVKDLDIFFENAGDYEDAAQYFDSMTPGYGGDGKRDEQYTFLYQNDNVKAYKHQKTGMTIELCRKTYGTAEEILEKFDFTVVRFAYYKVEVEDETGAETEPFGDGWDKESGGLLGDKPETHIEYKILMDDKFFEHLHMKRLVTGDNIPFPMSTFERMFRYARYGYFPCRETKMKIIKALRELPEQEVELPGNLYDGMD